MRFLAVSLIVAGAAALVSLAAPAASTAKKGAPAAKAPAKGGAKSVVPAAKRRGSTTAKRAVGRRATRRGSYSPYMGQQRPVPERIQEIERALAEKGFLASEPDSNWDQASMDAMRRFQQSQNITADGRLSALSLIALGLGARQNGVFVPAPAATPLPSLATPSAAGPPILVPPLAPPDAAMPEPRPAPVAARPFAPPPLPPPPPAPRPPAIPPTGNLPLVVPDTCIPQ